MIYARTRSDMGQTKGERKEGDARDGAGSGPTVGGWGRQPNWQRLRLLMALSALC